jgi:osmotically-inducible protein OsmY
MNRIKPIHTLALASILTGALAGCADFRANGSQGAVSSADITGEAQSRLDQMADLGPPGSVHVQTFANVVYLSGVVDGGLAKRNAEAVVHQVPGVQQVVDDIDVAHK